MKTEVTIEAVPAVSLCKGCIFLGIVNCEEIISLLELQPCDEDGGYIYKVENGSMQ